MHLSREIENWLHNLKNSEEYIIVEGQKDKQALENFGITNILILNKKPMYQLVEDISFQNINGKGVIILTDLDKKGKELYGKLNSSLRRHGVKVNDKPRNFLFKRTKLRQIEGLTRYVQTILQ